MRRRRIRRKPIFYSPRSLRSLVRETPAAGIASHAKVVTLVEPSMRPTIAEATRSCCNVIHTESISAAIAAAGDREVKALLVSPGAVVGSGFPRIADIVLKSPVVTVAIISEHPAEVNQGLLDLGRCGVRHAIDVSHRQGWDDLRGLVSRSADPATSQILESVMPAIFDSSIGTRQFMETLIRAAVTVTTVRALSRVLRVHPSSLMSRFFRAQLPAPKRYLASVRLMYAASYFENRLVSVASVADRLEYSSPQSFGRHVRTMMGMTAAGFRYRYSLQAMIDHFIKTLIAPHHEKLRSFDPLGLDRSVRGATEEVAV